MTIFFIIIITIWGLAKFFIRYSTIKIAVRELELMNKKIYKFNLEISLNLFGKLKWLKLTLNKKRIKNIQDKGKATILNKILETKILKDYRNIDITILKKWKKILSLIKEAEIEQISLNLKIGTENPAITAYAVAIISSVLAIILSRKISEPNFAIEPIYMDKNYIHLNANCIISLKLVHIININKQIRRKEVYQKYGRTSNRRTYAHSNG